VKSPQEAVFCFIRGFGASVRFDQDWAMVARIISEPWKNRMGRLMALHAESHTHP